MEENYNNIDDNPVPEKAHSARPPWRTKRGRVFVVLALLVALLVTLLQLPVIHEQLRKKAESWLSAKLEASVRVGKLRISGLDQIELKDVFVPDYLSDTLLSAGSIFVDFGIGTGLLMGMPLEVEAIDVRAVRLHDRRLLGSEQSTLTYALNRLSNPAAKKDTLGPNIKIRHVDLRDVEYLSLDSLKGKRTYAYVGKGRLSFTTFDLRARRIALSTVLLDKPVVQLSSFGPAPPPPPADTASASRPFAFAVEDFLIKNGVFALHNDRVAPAERITPGQIDFRHLDVYRIQVAINCFSYERDTVLAEVEGISLREKNGFILNKLASRETMISPRGISLEGLTIETPHSRLGDTLRFDFNGYTAFKRFTDEVRLDARVRNSRVAIRDISAFAPALQRNAFFRANRDAVLQLESRIRGEINNLSTRKTTIALGDGLRLVGDLSSRNLAVRNEEMVNLNLQLLEVSVPALRQLLPGFTPPPAYDRLGRIRFSGRFDGFFADFVAFGEFRTGLGSVRADMRMNFKEGAAKATYAGTLSMLDFNIGRLLDVPNLGNVSFATSVKNGRGLGANASAELTAKIQSLVFKGYNYRNASLSGTLKNTAFNGEFGIKDDNIDLNFKGEVSRVDSTTRFNFVASIGALALKPLNLSKEELNLAANLRLNVSNRRFASIDGEVAVTDIVLLKNGSERYEVSSIVLESGSRPGGGKEIVLRSEIAEGSLRGEFELGQLPAVLQNYVYDNYRGFAGRLGVKPVNRKLSPVNMQYELAVKESRGLHLLLNNKLGPVRDLVLKGNFDSEQDALSIDLKLPEFRYDNVVLKGCTFYSSSKDMFDFNTDSFEVGKRKFSTLFIQSYTTGDTVDFGITYKEANAQLDKFSVDGIFSLEDSSRYKLIFDNPKLRLFSLDWKLDRSNFIVFGKNYLDINNLNLSSQKKQIYLTDNEEGGISLGFRQFSFDLLDSLTNYKILNFGGLFDAEVKIGNVFKLKDMRLKLESDAFSINNDDLGWLRLDAELPSLQDQLDAYLSVTRDSMQMIVEATYNLADLPRQAGVQAGSPASRKSHFDINLAFANFPLKIAEYWLGSGISGTTGQFDADLRVDGLPGDLNVGGWLLAERGAFMVNYLKTRYRFDRSFVRASDNLFDATSTTIFDKFNNSATLTGGIGHDDLRNLRLFCDLSTKKFLAFDLNKGDNDLFYGTAIAEGLVEFRGALKQPTIEVRKAKTQEGTKIIIPMTETADGKNSLDIRFKKKSVAADSIAKQRANLIAGMKLSIEMNITQAAEMQIIFNEQAGDVIKGRGGGNIRMELSPYGEFTMTGDYNIVEGSYLFTLYNIVNKEFSVRNGGSIRWEGDPYNAKINLTAEYKDLRAAPATFIQEYLSDADADLLREAANSTPVQLQLFLQGDLLKPDISFAVDFPELRGQLKNYTDNKLRLLRQDPNELNRQVFGLIVVGQFIPSDLSFRGAQVVTNTLSEFLSNQLSLLINSFVTELWGEENAGINLDIAYNQYTSLLQTDGEQGLSQIGRNGLEVNIQKNFINNRLSVQLGGNVDFASGINNVTASNNGAIWGNDFALEYAINDARTLKLRIYQRRVPDIGGGRRIEVGSGLAWRREYSSLREFWDGFKRDAQKAKTNAN
jgi:hypothetical protein